MFVTASGRARAGVRTGIEKRSAAARTGRRFILAALAVLPAAACESPAARDMAPVTIVVTDDVGDTLRLAAPARRVLSVVPAQTEILLALGAGERLIARTDFDTQPELGHLPSTGNGLTPNVEWIAARRPDLVVSWADAQSRSVVSRLAVLGIPAYASSVESIEDILQSVERLGMLTGRNAAADSITRHIREELDAVERSVAGRPRQRVMYVIGLDPLMVAGPGTFVHEALTIAGGDNIFGDTRAHWPVVNIEEVIQRNPAVIILGLGLNAREADDLIARLGSRPGWRELSAMRSGRVHWADPYRFNRPSPDIAANARRLAEMMGNGEPVGSVGPAGPTTADVPGVSAVQDGPYGPAYPVLPG